MPAFRYGGLVNYQLQFARNRHDAADHARLYGGERKGAQQAGPAETPDRRRVIEAGGSVASFA